MAEFEPKPEQPDSNSNISARLQEILDVKKLIESIQKSHGREDVNVVANLNGGFPIIEAERPLREKVKPGGVIYAKPLPAVEHREP